MATRKRRVTATRKVEETVTIEETTTTQETDVIRWAPGWDSVPVLTGAALREQRSLQVQNSLRVVAATAAETDTHGDRRAVETAAIILRAGPGASVLERIYGRV